VPWSLAGPSLSSTPAPGEGESTTVSHGAPASRHLPRDRSANDNDPTGVTPPER